MAGHRPAPDLLTGAVFTEAQHRAKQPAGRAFLLAAEYQLSPEVPSDEYPLLLTAGRTIRTPPRRRGCTVPAVPASGCCATCTTST
ncbi:MAG TPA: hypothetical protein VIL37_20030 [Natronosporangium sp.]